MSLSRRQLLKGSLIAVAQIGAGVALVEAGRKGMDLLEQRDTWAEASVSNETFLARHATRLADLEFGASFAPEQWSLDAPGHAEARAALALAVNDLDLRRLRLGIRWSRAVDASGNVDLRAYAPFIDYCAANDVEICLNVGPIRTFRWPEEHVPRHILESLPELPPQEGLVQVGQPLADTALDYLDRLLEVVHRDYGSAISAIQVENEPFYPLGEHLWRLSPAYLAQVARHVDAVFPDVSLLVSSAGRLDLRSVRDLFQRLLAGDDRFRDRLISGFDFHYKTPLRDSIPVVRYFDQISFARPFAPGLEEHRRDARAIGFGIEVTEGQAEPYGHFEEPGNSAREFRYMVLRCLEHVFEPGTPSLLRIWGVEELTKRMLHHERTPEHDQIIELIQTVNAATHPAPEATGT